MSEDPRKSLRQLYRGLDGFGLSRAETRRIESAKSAATYGEIMPTATTRLLEYLDLGPDDVFYDLGSGIGKVVLHARMSSPAKHCVGLELSDTRCGVARSVARRARSEGLLGRGRCSFRCEDFMKSKMADATVVYTCSTAFPSSLMRRVAWKLRRSPRPLTFVTLQDLDPTAGIELQDVLHLDMSWRRRAKVHVYRVAGRAR